MNYQHLVVNNTVYQLSNFDCISCGYVFTFQSDVNALHAKIDGLDSGTNNRLDSIESTIDGIDTELDQVHVVVNGIDGKADDIEAKVGIM